jgi:hypothetical protein
MGSQHVVVHVQHCYVLASSVALHTTWDHAHEGLAPPVLHAQGMRWPRCIFGASIAL